MIPAEVGAERVRALAAEVLARAEFRPVEPSLLERLGESVRRWLGGLFGELGGEQAISGLVVFVIVVSLAALVLLGVRALVRLAPRARSGAPGTRGQDVRTSRVAASLALAREAARRGEHVRALRAYFVALVIGLSERGDLEYRDSWTNRELFERGRPRSDAARELAAWVPELDRKSFGAEPATAEDVERLATLSERWIGAREPAR